MSPESEMNSPGFAPRPTVVPVSRHRAAPTALSSSYPITGNLGKGRGGFLPFTDEETEVKEVVPVESHGALRLCKS